MGNKVKYEEALERARNELKQDLHESGIWAVKRIFPELRESEDEKIRKELLDCLRNLIIKPHEKKLRFMAWLEGLNLADLNLMKKFNKGMQEALMWGREGYEVSPDGKVKSLTQDEIDSILKKQKKQKSITNDGQQECPYRDLALVKNFFGEYKRKCRLSNKACDSKECKQWNELQVDFRNINEAFEDGKKEVIAHPEKYGLQKEQKPAEGKYYSSPDCGTTAGVWSEEDEHRRKDAIYFLECAMGHYADTSEIENTIAWLKSLRPQPQWKPTEEQLNSLDYGIYVLEEEGYDASASEIKELFDQLKKLMEE